jgi:hypothetical protein
MTLAASMDIDGGEGTMNTYYIVNPAPGTYTITFSISGGTTCSWAATATLYRDVDTADPIGATVSGGNSSGETSETDTITTTSAGSLIQDYVTNQNGTAVATNGTQLWPNGAASTGNGNYAYGSYLATSAAGVYNLNYGAGSAESWWEYEVVEIKAQNNCATATPTFSPTNTPTQTPTSYPTVCGGPPAFVQSVILNGVGVSSTSGCAGSGNPTSFNYNVPALPGEILIVQVEATAPVLSGVTWANNETLSALPSDSSVAVTGGGTIYTYYLVEPMPGNFTLAFNITSGCSWNAVASVYDNVNPANPFGAINTSGGDATTFADSITTEAGSSIIHDFFAYQSGPYNFTGMNGTQLFASNTSQCCDDVYGSYLNTSAPGAYTLDYTQPGPASADWTGVSIELEGSADCGTPTMVPTPVPGQMPVPYYPITATVLGTVPCSGSVQGPSPAILRSVADWNNYMAGAGCDTPAGALDLSTFNFAAQSVLILQYQDCGNAITVDLGGGPGVFQMEGTNLPNEYMFAVANIGFGSPPSPAPTGCESVAVAIPVTTLPVSWSICEANPSYHCITFVTP